MSYPSGGLRLKLYVKSLNLLNFRNYENLSLELSPGINIFYGNNAQGKTNILEAVYLGATSRSHRGTRDRDMISMGREESHIRMHVEKKGNDYRIDMHLKKNKAKGIAVGGVPIRKAADLYGIVSIIFFSPEDLSIIKNGPSERRRFMDQVICGIDSIYLNDLTQYNRCLLQRNRLLHDLYFEPSRRAELSIWNDMLAGFGEKIIKKRLEFISMLKDIVSDNHRRLTGGGEDILLCYEPNVKGDSFRDRLRASEETDRKMKTTTSGPHRDDFSISVKGMDLRTFGSQGQQRTAALALKLSEISITERKTGEKPVLLLDDVLSELDRERQDYLLSSIKGIQTLITCTGLDEFVRNHIKADSVFHVVKGGIE